MNSLKTEPNPFEQSFKIRTRESSASLHSANSNVINSNMTSGTPNIINNNSNNGDTSVTSLVKVPVTTESAHSLLQENNNSSNNNNNSVVSKPQNTDLITTIPLTTTATIDLSLIHI